MEQNALSLNPIANKRIKSVVNQLFYLRMKIKWSLQLTIMCSTVFLFSSFKPIEKKNSKVSNDFTSWAKTPPMGWNSFDAWDCRINEEQFKASVTILADSFLSFGYNYAILDYIWFNDNPGAWNNPRRRYGHPDLKTDSTGVPIERINLDEFGRVIPSPLRFPTSKNGQGFKPLADWVHSKGLKFGIHIMRGIPRQAFYDNLPIKGTKYTARDIAEPWDTCNWNNNMFGVNSQKPGAQEYYNSLFDLFAQWGVDFVKADNMMFPEYHDDDIEMMRKAIDQTGRPILLSLSNGEAPISYASHLKANANLWRVSGDFWDEWDRLKHNFLLVNQWSPFINEGSWPDADMIPFGKISLNGRPQGPERTTHFTRDEQYTLMSLWSIIRSPLIIGADLLSLDNETKAILTNPEIIAINQNSSDNKQIYIKGDKIIWMANIPGSTDKYFALFNISDETTTVKFDFELIHLRGKYAIRDLWQQQDLGEFTKYFEKKLAPHASGVYRMSEIKE